MTQHSTRPDFNPSGSPVVAEIKRRTEELMSYIAENVPGGRHVSLALTNYELAAMWAVKAATGSAPERAATTDAADPAPSTTDAAKG